MKVRTLLLLIVLIVIAAFTALNWGVFMAPATLSLGIATVQAPLGLVMLGMLAFLVALFLVFVVYFQTSLLLDTRRNARELQVSRELADQAEASRFTELRGFLEEALKKQADTDAETRAAVLARLAQLDRDLRAAIEESGNTISAYIGELDDRLERTKG
ncbi:MAG: Signal transduction histidine kinase [Deltaproteobacteria bacterium RIFOXYD12_FULL_56_24]|nr:MAG: Signal transduction histidine kinase [Deltaproteobacteria bacterium RIFOXYD12_FULL_56_24]